MGFYGILGVLMAGQPGSTFADQDRPALLPGELRPRGREERRQALRVATEDHGGLCRGGGADEGRDLGRCQQTALRHWAAQACWFWDGFSYGFVL